MNIIIFGAGAIGCHLAYCLDNKKNNIAIITKKKYLKLFQNRGISLKIYSNERLKKSVHIKENKNIFFYSDLKNIDKVFKKKIDAIFITLKLKDFSKKIEKAIFSISGKKTSVIPPCTYLSRWWFYSLFKNSSIINKQFSDYKYFRKYKNNIVGMTMWLSGKVTKPGFIEVKHVQRGYPILEFNKNQKKNVMKLRRFLSKKCISPKVKNIFSELYIKAINSFAFNLLALKTEYNNKQLKKDKKSINSINKIFEEFDNIIMSLSLPILQTKKSRIKQTLTSTSHTLSMLYDFKNNKKVELPYLWNTFKLLSNLTNSNIDFTRQIYFNVIKKLKK